MRRSCHEGTVFLFSISWDVFEHWIIFINRSAVAYSVTDYVLLPYCPPFLFLFYFGIMRKFEDGLGILGEWMYSTPIFWTLPLHLEGWNLPFLMELRDFIFFQILFFIKIEYTRTFISTIGIFISLKLDWKGEFTKTSSRIASVMEIFCTLLQCKVHLTMFHSSPTSKIWYTST
jgi:hypothetical protein